MTKEFVHSASRKDRSHRGESGETAARTGSLSSTRRRFLRNGVLGAGAVALGGLSTGVGAAQLGGIDLPVTTIIGESGAEIQNQPNPDTWYDVSFSNPLVELLNLIGGAPVVLMKPASYRHTQPVHIRLRNVDASGFEYKLEEWDYQDGSHGSEKIFWIAIAPVASQIPTASGLAFNMQAGSTPTDTTGTAVEFNTATDLAFQGRPIALAQSQTNNGKADSVITRVDGVDNTGFNVRLQEQEANGDYHRSEEVGYVAIDVPAGGGLLGIEDLNSDLLAELGLTDLTQDALLTEFEARRPTRPIQDSPSEAGRIPFTQVNDGDGFDRNPRVVADMQTRRGPQPANLRRTALTREYMDLFVQEEQSADDETRHANEDIGFLAFGGNGLIPGTILNIDL